MEKRSEELPSDSSPSTSTTTTFKTVVGKRTKKAQNSSSSSEQYGSEVDSNASTVGDSISSFETDPSPQWSSADEETKKTSAVVEPAAESGSARKLAGESDSDESADHALMLKKPRLVQQKTLTVAENLPQDTTPGEESATPTVPILAERAQDDVPMERGPSAQRPRDLQVTSCLQEQFTVTSGSGLKSTLVPPVIGTGNAPTPIPQILGTDTFKAPTGAPPSRQPCLRSNTGSHSLSGASFDEIEVSPMDESGGGGYTPGSDSSSDDSSARSVKTSKLVTPSYERLVESITCTPSSTLATPSYERLVESITPSPLTSQANRSLESQRSMEGGMEISEDDRAGAITSTLESQLNVSGSETMNSPVSEISQGSASELPPQSSVVLPTDADEPMEN